MLNSTLRRSIMVTGSVTAVAALALTCASGAQAAASNGSTATAKTLSISLLGQKAVGDKGVTATNDGTQAPVRVSSAQVAPPVNGPVEAGVFGVTALANAKTSAACAGVLQPGGTLSLGSDGTECNIGGPRRGGVTVDLASVLSALPLGIGSVKISMNSVTAFSQTTKADGPSGFAKVSNLQLQICLGVQLGGSCVGQQVVSPIRLKGTPNEDVLPAILTSLTKNAQLGALGTMLAAALAPALDVQSNVQTLKGGVFTVTGLEVLVGGGKVADVKLSIASTGPNGTA